MSRQALQFLDRAQAQVREARRQGSLDDLGGLVLLPRPQGPQRLGSHLGRFVFQRVAQQRIYLRGALAVGSQLNQAVEATHPDVFVTGLQRRIGHCQHVGAADLGIGLQRRRSHRCIDVIQHPHQALFGAWIRQDLQRRRCIPTQGNVPLAREL